MKLYGRERDARYLIDFLISNRIVLLYSPSGAGKTSLIRAKLVAGLEAEDFLVLSLVRVGPEPRADGASAAEMRAANRYVLSTLQAWESGLAEAQRTPPGELMHMDLPTWFDRLPVAESKFPLVIFDQFEEILTADPTDRAAKEEFFTQLGSVLRDRSRWALFAMREDFVPALDPFVHLLPTRLANTVRLDLLDDNGALEAVTRPAQQAGIPFAGDAARELVDELRLTQVQRPDGSTDTVKGQYVEPVQLQVVCYTLWQRLPPGVTGISLEHLRKFGDVNQALSGFYERTLLTASREAHVSVRRLRDWFENELITSGGTRGLVYRGAQDTAHLPNRAVDVLEHEHIIRAESRAGARWYELTHDRFVQPIKASNAAWERRRWRGIALRAVAGVVGLGVLGLGVATLVYLNQQATIVSQQEDIAATATALAIQKTAEVVAQQVREDASARATATVAAADRQAGATATSAAGAVVGQATATRGVAATTAPTRPGTPSIRPTVVAAASATPRPTLLAALTSIPTPAPPPNPAPTEVRVGESEQDKPMIATRVGNGPVRLGVIGALHGGEETTAFNLVTDLQRRVVAGALQVPTELTLFILPTLNPDDLQRKSGFNSRGVDLNRNFPVLWASTSCGPPTGFRYRQYGGCKPNGGGTEPFSERESKAAQTLIEKETLDTVVIVDSGLNGVSSRNGGDGLGESLALDVKAKFSIPYDRECCATYPLTGQLVDWIESTGRRGLEINGRDDQLNSQGIELLSFVLERAAEPTCTPTLQTGEFALKESPNAAARDRGIVSPGEEVIVKAWSSDSLGLFGGGLRLGGDPWLYVTVSRPADDKREGWMFTRETNNARPRCSFNLDDTSAFRFPYQ